MAGEGVGVGVGAVDVGGVDGALGVERRGFSSFLSVRSFGPLWPPCVEVLVDGWVVSQCPVVVVGEPEVDKVSLVMGWVVPWVPVS